MEFRIRAADDQSAQTSTPPAPHPAVAVTAVNPPLFQGGIPMANNASQREIEKQKIRQEILATENLRQELEMEVRREIAMERALQRSFAGGPHGFAFQQWSLLATPTLEGGVPSVSQPQPPQVVAPPEIESSSDPSKNQVFVLDKNDPQVCGDKRKAEIGDVSSPSGPNKKLKQGFSCELCQVSATSKKGLHDHVRGKKHRAKEAALKGQRIGLEEVEKPSLQPSGMGEEAVKQLLQCCITEADMNLMMVDDGAPESKAEEQHGQQNQNPVMGDEEQHGEPNQNIIAFEDSNETVIGNAVEEPIASTQNHRFKSWCEICQVGTHSQKVMENHINGRKHRRNMKTHTVSSSSASQQVPALIVDTAVVNNEEPCPAAESNTL